MTITPAKAIEIANAIKLSKAAMAYADALRADAKRNTLGSANAVDAALFELATAAINVVDNGDFMTTREVVCEENGWDNEGYPIDEDGYQTGAPYLAGAGLPADTFWRESAAAQDMGMGQ